MAAKDQQGTGKHPHKSTEEPYPHTKESAQGGEHSKSHAGSKPSGSSRGGGGSQSSDLKDREYRDKQGNVHHHTHTYEEQHGKK
jgi:hypothetical protein